MEEKIHITDFLVIKNAELEIKQINVLIGPQANGKSVIAKLLYFFQGISTEFLKGIRSQLSKRELDKAIIDKFESYFPKYAWDGTGFSIVYTINDIQIEIHGQAKNKTKTKLSLKYSEELKKLYTAKKRIFLEKINDNQLEEEPLRGRGASEASIYRQHILVPLRTSKYSDFFSDPIFIPASRSFFANLQKNIFTFLSSNVDIDPFLTDFGSFYERAKALFKEDIFIRNSNDKQLIKNLYKAAEKVINGEYEYKDKQDWIISTKGKRTNLANASSGQQESLPMLIVLCVLPILKNPNLPKAQALTFIEEPEAHLFPSAQSLIVSIITELSSTFDLKFFITSHSPYILSALNNCILGSEVLGKNEKSTERFQQINNGSGAPLDFEKVSAYTIMDGKTINIIDSEYKMIGAEMLDEVSDHFQDVMNNLLNME
uniref:Endonuclease GajA/Old nuclease/RecF-like AAA domain-containing protein n=1 Tax=Hydrogenovibrio crunogenus (strain DSM 25203 / XCL-2) TaxID=317025 RepID=Q31GX3_HYDCU